MSDHYHHDDDPAREHNRPLSGPALRVKALESLLIEKGLVDAKALDEIVDTFETKVGPRNGARQADRAAAALIASPRATHRQCYSSPPTPRPT